MIITLTIVFITIIFFIYGRVRSDIVALAALLLLMATGILTPDEALTGFSNPIVFTIAAMFIISGAIVRSGLANLISSSILGLAGTNQKLLFMLIMLITSLIGSLVSNTGTVAIMMPIVASIALSLNINASRLLMPLAFMAGIGGMLTLVGNPPNMVVNDVYMKAGYEPLKLFSFLPLGMVCMVFGLFVLSPVTAYLLKKRSMQKEETVGSNALHKLADKYNLAKNIYKVRVPHGSACVGKSLGALKLTAYEVSVQEIERARKHGISSTEEQIVPEAKTVLQAMDSLSVLGTLEAVERMVAETGLTLIEESQKNNYKFESIGICELVIMSASRLVNRKIADAGLREQFGVMVLGIQRGDKYILKNLREQEIFSGDALLVQGSWDNINRLDAESSNWVVVGKPMGQVTTKKQKIPYLVAIIIGMVAVMATGIIPTVLAALAAAFLTIAVGCFKNVRDAYSFIGWETLIMVSCMLPLATAMEKVGIVDVVGNNMSEIGLVYGPLAALAAIYMITSLLNTVVSFTPLALLIAPIAMEIAQKLGVSPLPFMMTVAAAAGLCFGSSFSTPSNALVVSAGRYTFMDYLKIGLPLQLLLGVVLIFAIPLIFPF